MQWTVNVHIEKHRGEKVSDKPFPTSNSFPSVEEATEHCFNFGKQIVDGEIENCFVEDL